MTTHPPPICVTLRNISMSDSVQIKGGGHLNSKSIDKRFKKLFIETRNHSVVSSCILGGHWYTHRMHNLLYAHGLAQVRETRYLRWLLGNIPANLRSVILILLHVHL